MLPLLSTQAGLVDGVPSKLRTSPSGWPSDILSPGLLGEVVVWLSGLRWG